MYHVFNITLKYSTLLKKCNSFLRFRIEAALLAGNQLISHAFETMYAR